MEANTYLQKLSRRPESTHYQPDIRNWNVLGSKGHKLGVVKDLWVDNQKMKIRYLDILLESDEHFLLPVGLASINRKDKYLIAIDITKADLPKYPVFDGERITRQLEQDYRKSYKPSHVALPEEMESDFYNHNHFNEHNLFGIRNTRRSRYIKKGNTGSLN